MSKWLFLLLLTFSMQLIGHHPPISNDNSYVLVGGQTGKWFKPGQNPALYKIRLSDQSLTQLRPVPSEGTVWTGGWNGSQWLITGWGTDPGPTGSNPYIYLYDGQTQIVAGSLNQYKAESSWHGGDIFAASYNGKFWLLSGMGSDKLVTPAYQTSKPRNHMALATFDGHTFTDLSALVPRQQDAILYANVWNGTEWLVGGGYGKVGVLFAFDGSKVTDLTGEIFPRVESFGPVQSIAWNGKYWLVGGIHFFAKYQGNEFTDLTSQLDMALSKHVAGGPTVNAIAWNGLAWLLGGGTPVAHVKKDIAWVASYSAKGFMDLSSALPSYVPKTYEAGSSILTIGYADGSWILGGFADGHGVLLSYANGSFTDLSTLVRSTMTYVIWVGTRPQSTA